MSAVQHRQLALSTGTSYSAQARIQIHMHTTRREAMLTVLDHARLAG